MNRPIATRVRPYRSALYFSMPMIADQPASCTDLDSLVRASPATDRSSTAIPWFSEISLVENWWWNSRRASATWAWARATLPRALGRDHFTFTAPIFGRFSRPLPVMLQRALAVNRIDCRASLGDLKRGEPTFRPLRAPLREAKKLRYALSASRRDCCRTTAETSPSQDRSGVRFASVISLRDS
ncbi:hypothetical protein SsS58_01903 [Streptomyces scabiei]|uniref:Uncharacterized protein n=1 Tax=Streptomyces scabiei TaxID=1930 RepID=A0A100JL54_STRSC|nr:hypothetical protein SsS58_01903 [Streptomyces scabiei]